MRESGAATKAQILLVEDNEDDFVLVETFLPRDEYAITWCSSARMAREWLRGETFDLVLLDHGLPDSNSLQFLEEIRQHYPSYPVIVLTGRNDQALAISAKKMGASTYLLKDEIIDHLLPTVREVLAHSFKPVEVVDKEPGAARKTRFVDTAERFYRVLLETMSEGCLVVDADGIITFANRALDSLTHCGAERLPGKMVLDMFTADSARNLRDALGQLAASRVPRSVALEARIAPTFARVRDGGAAVRISMRSLHADDGQYEGAVLVLTDVSELLQAKQLLSEKYQAEKAQHNQLRAIIESSRDGIMLVDRDLRLLVLNGRVVELLQLPGGTERWTNRSLLELLSSLRGRGSAYMRTAVSEIRRLQSGDTRVGKGEFDIDPYIVCWLNLPVHAESSRLLILQDVTAEREVQQMREDLVRTTVHDLRNPLGVISGALEQLKELGTGENNDEASSIIDIASAGTHKMLTLVNQILDVSRLESGMMPLNLSARSLNDLIHKAVHAQSTLATVRGVQLAHVSTGGDQVALVDPSMIDRVLQNLIDNAIKFTIRGGTVEIRSGLYSNGTGGTLEPGNGAQYYVSVADHGPGVPTEIKDRLFEKFVTGSTGGGGSGLGLAFCKLAIEAHRGRIWFENAPGRGATFFFTVPAIVG